MISFNQIYLTGREQACVARVGQEGVNFTQDCQRRLEEIFECRQAVLMVSYQGAIELACVVSGLVAGDEVIISAFTGKEVVAALTAQGLIPIVVDIESQTLNINVNQIESAITQRTKAIITMHYAGVGCALEVIQPLVERYGLIWIEDLRHAFLAMYQREPLGQAGHVAILDFGEGQGLSAGPQGAGALLINDQKFIECIQQQTATGLINKAMKASSEEACAFLFAQLQEAETITLRRIALWQVYHEALAEFEEKGLLHRPIVPKDCYQTASDYYIIFPNAEMTMQVRQRMEKQGVEILPHYVALNHRKGQTCLQAMQLSPRLLRLPLWPGLEKMQLQVIEALSTVLRGRV